MLKSQTITKLEKGKFKVLTDGAIGELILDFKPLIKFFDLSGNYQLIHFQATPKGHRRWGVYRSRDDNYLSCQGIQLTGNFKTLLIPDNIAKTVPNAVIYTNAKL